MSISQIAVYSNLGPSANLGFNISLITNQNVLLFFPVHCNCRTSHRKNFTMKLPILFLHALLIAYCGTCRSQTYTCKDSAFLFKTKENDAQKCDNLECDDDKTRTHCPVSCKSCACADSMATFQFEGSTKKTCAKIKKKKNAVIPARGG